jgi:chorismate mutase
MENGTDPAACRGIRGATTVDGDGHEGVEAATVELLEHVVRANGCRLEDVAAVIFTVPEELTGTNPAAAARAGGWDSVPLLVVREHGGDTEVPHCLRALILWNTARSQGEIRHVYLRGAKALRPDLAGIE